MTGSKTPKVLRKKGIRFLEKSTHYDNIENIELESVVKINSVFLKQKFVFQKLVFS